MLDMLSPSSSIVNERAHIRSLTRSSGGEKGQRCEEAMNFACCRGLQVHKLPEGPAGPAVGASNQAATGDASKALSGLL